MTLVLRNCDLDVTSVVFADPKPSGHGGNTIYVNYMKDSKKHKLCQIQTPWLFNPFGLNSTEQFVQDDEQPKYSVELSFGNAPSEYVESFHEKMRALDAHVKEQAVTKQREWLNKADVDDEYLSEFYKPVVKPYKNKQKEETGEHPDTIRFKIPHYINEDGTSSFGGMEIYDAERNLVPIKTIEDVRAALGRGNRVRAIAQCHSVWQSGNEFGVSWKVVRLQMLKSGASDDNTQCAFLGGSEDGEGGNSDEESFE